jgi:hypothetical protein
MSELTNMSVIDWEYGYTHQLPRYFKTKTSFIYAESLKIQSGPEYYLWFCLDTEACILSP